MQGAANIAKVVLALSIELGVQVFACTMIFPRYEVGPTFSVNVASVTGASFKDVRVILVSKNGGTKRCVLTSANGLAQFSNVAVGEYSLSIDMANNGDEAELVVMPGLGPQELKLRWPWTREVPVNSLRARLLDDNNNPYAHLILRVSGLDGRFIADGSTNAAGEFDFGAKQAGLYFVQVLSQTKGDYKPRGTVTFLVSSKGVSNPSLVLSMSSCGLAYSDVCRQALRDVQQIDGEIVDPSGGAIGRATIRVFKGNAPNRPELSGTSNASGTFSLKTVEPGEYEVEIRSPGFAPVFLPIRVDPNTKGSLGKIRMSIAGSTCGPS